MDASVSAAAHTSQPDGIVAGNGRLADYLVSERHSLGVVLVKPGPRDLLGGEDHQFVARLINPDPSSQSAGCPPAR
jgi:hypothetical protein